MILILALTAILMVSSTGAGVSYVRWGRTVCPKEATLLYKGYMAGAHYNVGGNGANYLCLHEHPKYVRPVAGFQTLAARIYGVELKVNSQYYGGLFSAENVNDGDLSSEDMPCAVCYVSGSSDQLMVPGRQDCGEFDYNLQYKGFLVADAHVSRHRGSYICLDEAPEGRPGGSGTTTHGVIYPVQVGCGSLPCNPYVDGYELPCSVCTL